jgi:hypothetical protein
MAARVVQVKGRKYDDKNWLLMHTVGANTGGQIGSVMAAAIMLSDKQIWRWIYESQRYHDPFPGLPET